MAAAARAVSSIIGAGCLLGAIVALLTSLR
jgi:hydroxyethylthiazole kinase-like sugar kinase family protein